MFNQVILCSGTTITTLVQATKHAQRMLAMRHLQNIYIYMYIYLCKKLGVEEEGRAFG